MRKRPPVAWAVVWVVVVNQKIAVAISNSCGIWPSTKFHPNRKVKKICYPSALVGWYGQSENICIHFKLVLFCY